MTSRRTPARSRDTGPSPDRGSMPLAMLVTLVGMLVSAALVPVVVHQIGGTRTVAARTQELQVAQAGIDTALGQLRAAATAAAGDLEKLPPCTMTGSTGPDGWNYRVTITYYELNDDGGVAKPLACPPTYVPATATLTATGGRAPVASLTVGSPGSRTVEATYRFKTNNQNITGGAIRLAAPAANPLCMDAGGSASPAAGTALKTQLCKAGGSSDQRFAYTADLNIKLVGSETAAAPQGMCVDVPYPRHNGDPATFQPCLGLQPRQQWSLNDSSAFSSTRENTVKLGDFCLSLAQAGVAGSAIVLGSCKPAADANTFRPQPGAGAGMASAKVNQLVNFQQFSRCLDVTNFSFSSTYMIVWFCKQSPDGNVPWNQQWFTPAQAASVADAVPGQIRSGNTGSPSYCLRSPGSTAPGSYVTVAECMSTEAAVINATKWKVMGSTGDYASSYRIMDAFGYCLTPTDLDVAAPDTHTDGTAKVKVAVCGKSELQKWNAPANLNEPRTVTNTLEK